MAATTKLQVWNQSLRELGGHPLADTTTVNTQQQALNDAWDHAVEYVLAQRHWNFALRRATLTGVSSSAHPPYTYVYTRPSDYLRKVWIREEADDEFQAPHAEVAAVIYGFAAAPVMEYVSDHADNYDPANWPPQFTRVVTIYLAMLVAPKVARIGADDIKSWYQRLDLAMQDAARLESITTTSATVSASHAPVIRRAMEMLGHVLAVIEPEASDTDYVRLQVYKGWDHAIEFVLSQAPWNFAAKRAVLQSGDTGDENVPTDTLNGLAEGYSVEPASADTDDPPDISGYDYSFPLPEDFVHKVWLKASVHHDVECPHQFLGGYVFLNYDPAIMEYVANDSFTSDPDNWPVLFKDAVAAYLAWQVSPSLVMRAQMKGAKVPADMAARMEENFLRKLSDAKNKDAIQQYPEPMPLGRFARARMGSSPYGSRRYMN